MTAVADFECVAQGTAGRVLLSPKAHAEYMKVRNGTDERSVKRRVKLERHFAEFASHNPPRLNDEQFKREGAFPDGGGKSVAVWEFKAWQWRVYGGVFLVDGRKCFVGLQVDPDKKQNRADQEKLKAVAKEIGRLDEYKALAGGSGGRRGQAQRKR